MATVNPQRHTSSKVSVDDRKGWEDAGEGEADLKDINEGAEAADEREGKMEEDEQEVDDAYLEQWVTSLEDILSQLSRTIRMVADDARTESVSKGNHDDALVEQLRRVALVSGRLAAWLRFRTVSRGD